jgi:sulfonate transport system permease protein
LPYRRKFDRAWSPLALLAVWQIAARSGALPANLLASPSSVLSQLAALIVTGELPINFIASLLRVSAGLMIGIVMGGSLALVAGLSRRGEFAIDPLVHIFRTLPVLALVPLFILWFGIGEGAKIALIALGVCFPIYLNLFAGVRGVDPKLVEAGRQFGLSGAALVRRIILPGALASFLTGLRFAIAIAWLVLVVVEQFNASSGLGFMMSSARDFMRTDVIVVCLIVYALLGLSSDMLVRALERRLLAWRLPDGGKA